MEGVEGPQSSDFCSDPSDMCGGLGSLTPFAARRAEGEQTNGARFSGKDRVSELFRWSL